LAFLVILGSFLCGWSLWVLFYKVEKPSVIISGVNGMNITSPSFNQGESVPEKFTCEGKSVNPELIFREVPAGTKSIALIMNDPDVPSGTFTHWLVWNMPPQIPGIAEGTLPQGALEGATSLGKPGYVGPCPPAGKTHRYYFRVFALDEMPMDLNTGASRMELERGMQGHVLAEGELMGIYRR